MSGTSSASSSSVPAWTAGSASFAAAGSQEFSKWKMKQTISGPLQGSVLIGAIYHISDLDSVPAG